MRECAFALVMTVGLGVEAWTQRSTEKHGEPQSIRSVIQDHECISPCASVSSQCTLCPFFPTARLSFDFLHASGFGTDFSYSANGFLSTQHSAPSTPKSPLVAGLLSGAIPGVGQSYSEDWSLSWKSLAFLGAEVALWTGYAIYKSDADEQTTLFQAYADEHWSVVRYVEWIESFSGQSPIPNVNTGSVWKPVDPTLPPWERVDWAELNRVEEEIGRVTGTGFTHRLPIRPEQQYYELIGKYAQYGGGWNDASGFTPSDLLADRVSARFREYSAMRGKANDLYYAATTISTVIVVNHLLSALEAAWSTSRANKRVEAEAELKEMRIGGKVDYYTEVSMKWKL